MGRYLKLLLFVLSFLIIYGGYYWGLPAIINLPEKVDFIEQEIQTKTGYKVKGAFNNGHKDMRSQIRIELQ